MSKGNLTNSRVKVKNPSQMTDSMQSAMDIAALSSENQKGFASYINMMAKEEPKSVWSDLKILSDRGDLKLNKGSLYKVELAPKENEYLLYDKTLGEQTKDACNGVESVSRVTK